MTLSPQLKLNFFAHFTDGVMLSLFGPLLPFLAQATSLPESEFNYIFAMRGLAYILAGVLQKTVLNRISVCVRMQGCLLLAGVCFLLFGSLYSDWKSLAGISFFLNVGVGSISILANVCLLSAGRSDTKYYVSLSYGVYGIGAMLGPILVSICGLFSLKIVGVWSILLGCYYFTISSEEVMSVEVKDPLLPSEPINKTSQYALCGMFLLYSSITLSFRSWLPSFAVMEAITTKENAALALSLYSIFLTAFRFVFILLNTDLQTMLRYTSILLFITLLSSLVSYASTDIFIVFGNSIILGVLFSNYCPYLYSLPARYGKTLTAQATSNTIIAYAMGEAIVSALIGYLMEMIHPLMLFVALLGFALVNIFLLEYTIRSLALDASHLEPQWDLSCPKQKEDQ